MSEPKFTPGPWLVGRPHNEDVPSAINGWNYYPIYYGNDEEQVESIIDDLVQRGEPSSVLTRKVEK